MISAFVFPQPRRLAEVELSDYSEPVREVFNSLGLLWDKKVKRWRGDETAVAIAIQQVRDSKLALVRERQRLMQLSPALPIGPYPRGFHLYQLSGAGWLQQQVIELGAAILADEMGLGKSCQAIVAAAHLDWKNPLVICPAIVVPHWKAEITKWDTDSARNWHVMSYDAFRIAAAGGTEKTPRKLPEGIDGIILDEIHYISSKKALRSKAIAAWRKAHPDVPTIGLSGTPMLTRPCDLWHPLHVLFPERWGEEWSFQKRYCDGRYIEIRGLEEPVWTADGVSRADELQARLRPLMLRRTKAEVALELPSRIRTVIEVELPLKSRKALAKAAMAIDNSSGVSSLLSQVEEHKLESAVELANEVIATGGRPLLLTTRREAAKLIAEKLNCPVATGADEATDRRDILLSSGGPAVATIYAVTTGINLVEFDTIIFTGLDWVPSTLLQAEARIHRIGQQKSINVYYLVAMNTLDEVVRARVIERLDTFTSIVGGGDEGGLANDLGGGNDEDLLASLVAAAKEMAA